MRADESRRAAILGGREVWVIGFLETIKVQFRAGSLSVVDTPKGPVLRCSLPHTVYRIQRRDAYRVRPLVAEPIICFVRDGRGGESGYRVIDFSVTGVAYAMPPGAALPPADTVLRHCRLEVGQRIAIPCDLVVRHVSEGLLSEGGAHRIGCEFEHLASEPARSLQLTVMDIEKRGRATTGPRER